jgi:hypothetical protein
MYRIGTLEQLKYEKVFTVLLYTPTYLLRVN